MSDPAVSAVSALVVDPETVGALADLLGADDVDASPGAALPTLWHWAALARWRPWSSLGPDGHSEDGSMPLRPDLPRRMFAGGEVTVHRPLTIGATVRVERTIEQVRDTEGRSGPLRFVTVRDHLLDDAGLAIDERLDIVYRAPATPRPAGEPVPEPDPGPGGPAGIDTSTDPWRFHADPAMLFRFSALTRNTHRIHYDRAYTTTVEGYDDLVVHGPLIALVLAESVRRTGAPIRRLQHRGRAPLLGRRVGKIASAADDDSTTVQLVDGDHTFAEITSQHRLGHPNP